ncbi:MAG: GH3 auxin-responsive promoter family protein [Myxococcaceae bacterium]
MSVPLLAYGLKFWLWPYRLQFISHLKSPKRTQDRVLRQIVNNLSHTKYGLLFNVNSRDSYTEFSKKVPVVTYDKLKHWIDRQKSHESNILVNESITQYTYVHGTKLLPYTKSLEGSFFRFFAIQLANSKLSDLDIQSVFDCYKSYWSGKPISFPKTLLSPNQPYKLEAPLLIKLPQSPSLLPLLSEVFFEFADKDKKIWRLHELQGNTEYDVIISQKSGLYRYQVGLSVLTCEFFKKTPSFQVLHDSYSDFGQTSEL